MVWVPATRPGERGGGLRATESAFGAIPELRPYKIWKGATARAVHGQRLTMAVVDVDPDQDVPEHSHDNEQLGFVLRGHITMTIGGRSRTLSVGETYSIPPNTPHSAATGPDGATVVDIFAPIRSDWEKVERLEPEAGLWP
jgi:quercetin dioxygenase-like cupin family protein